MVQWTNWPNWAYMVACPRLQMGSRERCSESFWPLKLVTSNIINAGYNNWGQRWERALSHISTRAWRTDGPRDGRTKKAAHWTAEIQTKCQRKSFPTKMSSTRLPSPFLTPSWPPLFSMKHGVCSSRAGCNSNSKTERHDLHEILMILTFLPVGSTGESIREKQTQTRTQRLRHKLRHRLRHRHRHEHKHKDWDTN